MRRSSVHNKIRVDLSLDPPVVAWAVENLKPSMSAAVNNWLKIQMKGSSKIGKEEIIKSKADMVDRMVEKMLAYAKLGKNDSPIDRQMDRMTEGLQFIFKSDFATDITVEKAKEMLMKKLKEKGYNG